MTVKELIEKLSALPQNAGVFVENDDNSISPLTEVHETETETDFKTSVVVA